MLDPLLAALTWIFISRTTITTQYEITKQSIPQVEQGENDNISKIQPLQGNVWQGKISIYSATYGGCLYCQKHFDENGQLYYLTASGERLNDSLFTLAANFGNLGDMVSVCNLSNFKCVGAKINDLGGFDTPEYNNRIADLSIATAQAIEAKTDQSLIEISKVPRRNLN